MNNDRTLSREVPATIVPYGDQVSIPEGTLVTITHRLGGNFTVTWSGGMAQINGRFADALGEELPAANASDAHSDNDGPASEGDVWDALKKVYDPEIPVNIVDLGLVYSLALLQDPDNPAQQCVKVEMTLTAPGCGMGPAIAQDAKFKIEQIPSISEATVDIVWDPPWNQDMISEEGKMELGLI